MSTSLVLTPLQTTINCDYFYPCESHELRCPGNRSVACLANPSRRQKTTTETFLRAAGCGILALKDFNRGFLNCCLARVIPSRGCDQLACLLIREFAYGV